MSTARPRTLAALGLAALLAACHHDHHDDVRTVREPRTVSIQVEVYEPGTNFVWEGVGVRVVESAQEWSDCVCENPDPDDYLVTDSTGGVLFDAFDLAGARVGFQEDHHGRAVLTPFLDEDEAFVLIEVFADGFESVFVDVPLSWDQPDVFVEVPFVAP